MLTLSIILCLYKHTEGQYKVTREFFVFGSENFIVDKVYYLQKFNFLLIKIIAFWIRNYYFFKAVIFNTNVWWHEQKGKNTLANGECV